MKDCISHEYDAGGEEGESFLKIPFHQTKTVTSLRYDYIKTVNDDNNSRETLSRSKGNHTNGWGGSGGRIFWWVKFFKR